MKDLPEITAVFESFVGWSKSSPPMAEFTLPDGNKSWAGVTRVKAMYEDRNRLHPTDQKIVTDAFRTYVP